MSCMLNTITPHTILWVSCIISVILQSCNSMMHSMKRKIKKDALPLFVFCCTLFPAVTSTFPKQPVSLSKKKKKQEFNQGKSIKCFWKCHFLFPCFLWKTHRISSSNHSVQSFLCCHAVLFYIWSLLDLGGKCIAASVCPVGTDKHLGGCFASCWSWLGNFDWMTFQFSLNSLPSLLPCQFISAKWGFNDLILSSGGGKAEYILN